MQLATLIFTNKLVAPNGILFSSIFSRGHEFNLSDCAPYFLSNVKRLSDPAYIPTTQDILHTRVKTCGIVEVSTNGEHVPTKLVLRSN